MSLREQQRKPDWLKELQAALVVCLLVAGVFGVFAAVAVIADDSITVRLPASAVTGEPDLGLRGGATIAATQDLEVVVSDPTMDQRLAWILSSSPSYTVLLAVLALLVWIVREARHGDPFTPATVWRLRALAVVTLAGVLAGLIETVASSYLSGTVASNGIVTQWSPPVAWLLGGFGLLAVAELINRGCAMRAELETVV
jgi:hypothetical protein